MNREIKTYHVSRFGDGRAYIGLSFTDNTAHTINLQSPQDGLLVLDILRHEKPVFMDAYGTLFTGPEPVGEHEE